MGLVVLVGPHALQLGGVVIFKHVFHLFVRHLVRLYGRSELTPELFLLGMLLELLLFLYSRLLVLVWLSASHELLVLFVITKSLLLFVLVELL
jgi:hypothetical protein